MKEMILQTVADKGPQNVQDIVDMLESVPVAIGKGRHIIFHFCYLSHRSVWIILHAFVKTLLNHFYSIVQAGLEIQTALRGHRAFDHS